VRDTKYAKEIREPGVIKWPTGSEGRIERLFVKKIAEEAIRFSWWKNGKLATRPLDLSESDLLQLIKSAVENHVFTDSFLSGLKRALG